MTLWITSTNMSNLYERDLFICLMFMIKHFFNHSYNNRDASDLKSNLKLVDGMN